MSSPLCRLGVSRERFGLRTRRPSDVIGVLLVITFAMAIASHGWTAIADGTGYRLVKSLVFQTGSRAPWYVSAYQADVIDLTTVALPAQLCFSPRADDPRRHCVAAEAHAGGAKYALQRVEALSVERVLNDGASAVLFVARFSGGGSGALRLVSLWGEGGAQMGLQRMLFQVMSEQSEYSILPVTRNGHRGVVVIADYEQSADETHFSPHHFRVRIFQLSADRSRFTNVDTYTTARKYPSLDDVDIIAVIREETAEIDRRLDHIRK